MSRKYASINARRALALYSKLLSWPKVGKALAEEDGRAMPYQGNSVYRAVQRYDRAPQKDAVSGGLRNSAN